MKTAQSLSAFMITTSSCLLIIAALSTTMNHATAFPTTSLYHPISSFHVHRHNHHRHNSILASRQIILSIPNKKITTKKSSSSSSSSCLQASPNNNDNSKNNTSEDEETIKLLEKARQLREQVSSLENTKLESQRQLENKKELQRQEEMKIQKQLEERRMRYSAEVPILKDMGEEVMERVDFPPRVKGGKSRILTIQSPLPLGILLGSSTTLTPTLTTIDEVLPTSNAYQAGAREGDILRAITACQTTMTTPTWQLLAGGIGQPKTKRFVYGVDGRPLEEVMEAVGSNRMDPEGRDVWLVLERVEE